MRRTPPIEDLQSLKEWATRALETIPALVVDLDVPFDEFPVIPTSPSA